MSFTIEVAQSSLSDLRNFTCAVDNTEAADFCRAEAEQYLLDYLDDNGIQARRVGEEYLWFKQDNRLVQSDTNV